MVLLHALLASLATLVPSPSAQQGCPFSGTAQVQFGSGTGVCALSVLTASLDTTACRVDFGFQDEPFGCGNVFLTQNFLLVGVGPLTPPVPLSAPFLPGSALHVQPFRVLGPFPGGAASIALPPQPGLIGQSLTFQSVPFFFSTIPFPGRTDLGTSTGLTVTLL